MVFLIAAVVLVGLVALADLILTLGVVKRLREHTEMLAGAGGMPVTIAVGEKVGDFTAVTIDGETVNSDRVEPDSLVAFFSPTCQPCKEKLPKFVAHARTLPGGRDQVLAVVVGGIDEASEFTTQLSPVARVLVEDREGPLHTAFQTAAYPTLLRVSAHDDGGLMVAANEVRLDHPAVALA
ncbi:redoxin domain-containing protein [Streptomyces sp. NPDC058280]|uniref:redoxin domain-containing protein n=1 Tax=Streptomyces sp. NPDC058280 TaxID=3346419 RepID=UPI0036E1B76E